jgi:CYTH domain-containing protein
MKNLEIERKWLLYREPIIPESLVNDVIVKDLLQFYTERGRFRIESIGEDLKFFHTIKKSITSGVSEEIENEITEEEFINAKSESTGFVQKVRFEWKENSLKFFVDMLTSGTMLLEVELPSIDFEFEMPSFLTECIYAEVTNDDRFNNYNLKIEIDGDRS